MCIAIPVRNTLLEVCTVFAIIIIIVVVVVVVSAKDGTARLYVHVIVRLLKFTDSSL